MARTAAPLCSNSRRTAPPVLPVAPVSRMVFVVLVNPRTLTGQRRTQWNGARRSVYASDCAAPRQACTSVRPSHTVGNVGQAQLKGNVRRVVDVRGVLGDTESQEPMIDPVAQAEREQVLLAGQLIEISRLRCVYAAADIGLPGEVGVGRQLVLVTENERGNDLGLLGHRRPRTGVVNRRRI